MVVSGIDAEALVRDVLRQHGKLAASVAGIAADADLYRLGLSSMATVNVMLEIETRLDASIPEEALTRETFRTIAALSALVGSLGEQAAT
ncbi:acyl carrier protein [Xanthobacteraceae bacterium A53D]